MRPVSRVGRGLPLLLIAKELARAKTVVIKSSKSDLYGRYLAEVFLSAEDVSLEDCFNTGRYLNDLLGQAAWR